MKLSRDSDIPLLRCTRLLMGGAAFMSISFAYELTNIVNTFSGRGVHSTEWTTVDPLVPLMVVFTLPYLVFMTIPLMLAHFLRTWKQWDAYMRSAVFVLIPTFIFFLVFPTVMVRPALPGAGMRVFFLDMIYWIDRPYNSFPSLHAVMGTMTLFISYQLNKARSKWVALPLTAMVISTIFTKQHYVLDMVIGAVVGIWGAVLFKQALVRKQWARSKLRVPKIRPDIFLFAFVSAIIFDWSTKYYFTQVLGQAQRAEQTPYFLTKDVVKMPADVYSFWQNFAFDGWVLRLNHHALPLFSWGACLAFVAGMIIFLPVRSHVRAKVSWAGKGLFQGALLGATMANGLEVVSTGKATNWLWLKDFGTVNLADVIVYSAGTAYFFVLSFRAGAYFSRVLRKRGPPLINHLRSLIRTKTPGALYPLAKNLGVFKAGFIETYLYFGIYHFYFLAMPAWAALTLSFLFIMALHGYYGVSDGNGGKFETNTVGQQILVSFKASLVAVLGFVPYFAFSFVPVPNDHVTYVTGVLVTLGALLHGWKNRMAAKVWMVGPNRLVAESKNNARMRQVFFHMGLLFCAVLVANAFTQQGHINSYEMVGLLFAATAATVMVSLLARAIYKGRYPLKESVIMLVTMAGLGALTGFSTVLNPSESESVVKGPFEIKKGAFKEDIAIVLEKGLPFDRIVLQPQSEEPAGTKIYFDEGSPTAEFSFSSVKQTELHVIAKTDTSNTPVRFHLYSTLIRDGGNRKLASMVGTFLSIATGTVLWMWKFGRRKTKVLLADAPASDETVTEIKALLAGDVRRLSVPITAPWGESHGCVRLPYDTARVLFFQFFEAGKTQVVITWNPSSFSASWERRSGT
jgi:membrane-associated phospholipid phosphatase